MTNPHRQAYHYEVRICKRLQLERIIDQSEGDCDGVNDWLCVEMFQQEIPKYLKKKVSQAIRASVKRGWKHLPIVVWREKHKEDDEALVIMRLKDFEGWYV